MGTFHCRRCTLDGKPIGRGSKSIQKAMGTSRRLACRFVRENLAQFPLSQTVCLQVSIVDGNGTSIWSGKDATLSAQQSTVVLLNYSDLPPDIRRRAESLRLTIKASFSCSRTNYEEESST